MAWEKHGEKRYYYRSTRVNGRVVKVYCGPGTVGRLAAEVDTRCQEERRAEHEARLAERIRLQALAAMTVQFRDLCQVLADAVLLTAGFHRPNRQPWRKSHAARQALVPFARAAGRR
jgi:hypothetical protein